jgi:hypothetical protein
MQRGEDTEDYGVFLDQARLEIEVEHGILEAEVSAELADALRPATSAAALDKPPYLRDAYLDARFTKALRLRAGHFKRPFSRLELTSSGVLPVRGRGLTNSLIVEDARFGGRALGLMLFGKLPSKLEYHAALSNPDWLADGSLETPGAAANARMEWEPVPELSLGADYGYRLEVVRGDAKDRHSHAAGVDAKLLAGPLEVVLDARLAQVPATAGNESPLAYGVAAYGRYDIDLGRGVVLQPVLLGEYMDADTDISRDEAVRSVIGLNLIPTEGLRVMPQVEIVRSLRDPSVTSPITSSERYYVLLSAQL